MKTPICKHCLKEGHYQTFCPNKPRKPIKKEYKCHLKTDLSYIDLTGTVKVEAMSWEKYQQKKGNKPAKPIPKISDKQKKINVAYMALRKVFMQTNPICQFKGCTALATDIHHMVGRSGENMLDSTTWMSICRVHHTWLHEHDKEARELGYIKSRLEK